MTLYRRLAAGLFLALAMFSSPSSAADEAPAKAVIENLNRTLIEVMRNAEALGYQGRYDRLAPVLEETFNFPVMARISVGRFWSKLSDSERTAFLDTFKRESIATFAARFDGYGGERFEVTGEDQAPRNSVLVRNQLVKGDGEVVPLNYLMRRYGARWLAVDVYLDAKYSELAVKRSNYGAIIGRDGIAALIATIEKKIAELEQGPAD